VENQLEADSTLGMDHTRSLSVASKAELRMCEVAVHRRVDIGPWSARPPLKDGNYNPRICTRAVSEPWSEPDRAPEGQALQTLARVRPLQVRLRHAVGEPSLIRKCADIDA
jgi:hypothetical protein